MREKQLKNKQPIAKAHVKPKMAGLPVPIPKRVQNLFS